MFFLGDHPLNPAAALRLGLGIGIAALGASRLGAAEVNEFAPFFTRIGRSAIVPAEVSDNGMYVSAMINGQGPFRMLVDTGCSFSMISPEVAAAVEARGLEAEDDGAEAINGLGGVVSMPRVVLDSVTVGGIQFGGVVAGVVPLELPSKITNHTLDGILGGSLFSDLFFALDFPNQTLVLDEDWPKTLPPVRAELAVTEHDEVPFIRVKLQGKDLEVMVDSGANDRLHLPPEEAASLHWTVEPRPGFLLAAAGETGRAQIGRLSGALELGPLRQSEPVVDVSGGPSSVGIGLLHSFCLVFHEADDKLWLCSAETGPLPSPPELSVGLSLLAEDGGWRVAGIIPHSPAEEAAIRPGDLVTEIEDQPALHWTRDQIQDWIDTHATLALKLAAPSGERDVTLRVWALVP